MQRRFRRYRVRSVEHLEGVWDFAFLGGVEVDAPDGATIQFEDRMAVPGCFDATPRYAGRRGVAAYRKQLNLGAGRHRLYLDGVHHWCRVLLDGQLLGEHAGGFTRFAFDLPRRDTAGEAELIVLVDNRIDPVRSPLHPDYYDWYHFGGLARGVELHRVAGDYLINSLAVTTLDHRSRQLRVVADVSNFGGERAVELSIAMDGRDGTAAHRETVTLAPGANRIERTLSFDGAPLWSPGEPNLHLLQVRVGDDDLVERVGIRQVRVEDRQILINDEPIRLLGFCRHEAHPQFGHAVPPQVMIEDVQLLRAIGCNFVRGAHYPQDPLFLDLCDEAGLLVWSEGTSWGNRVEHLTDPRWVEAAVTNLEEMVAADVNHPSIILWGVLNEGHSHLTECRPAYEKLLGRLRELDPSRPVTYASCSPDLDLCWDLTDVLAMNIYPGWYYGEIDDIPARIDAFCDAIERVPGQGAKPLIVSEIGAAAVYGCHDWNRQRWTEEYQADLLTRVIRHLFHDRDRFCGLSIWQFCDIRTTQQIPMALTRARGFNNKGVLDEYRRPKLAFDVVKRLFDELGHEGR